MRIAYAAVALLALTMQAQTVITVDRNSGAAATPKFVFQKVASPAKDDAGAAATLTILAGTADGNAADVRALVDGLVPATEDQPEANLFFKSNSWGGRVRFDLGRTISVEEIRSYSWHPDSRAPQLYKVFGADGTAANFDAAPSNKLDPATCGWTLIAFVDTRSAEGSNGGQYGVSVKNRDGALGRYRYLIFDFFETESEDAWGNTFYSEVDVVGK